MRKLAEPNGRTAFIKRWSSKRRRGAPDKLPAELVYSSLILLIFLTPNSELRLSRRDKFTFAMCAEPLTELDFRNSVRDVFHIF